MTVVRRYGIAPADRCTGANSCPDILQLDNGDFLVIGKRTDPTIRTGLGEHGASIGLDETAVVVPGEVVRAAALEIAAEEFAQPLTPFQEPS